MASEILLSLRCCAIFSSDKPNRWFHPNRSLPNICVSRSPVARLLGRVWIFQRGVVGVGKRGCLRWMVCREESVLMNHVSATGSSHWQSQTGSDRTPQMLMEGRGGTQAGLIAVWWSEVPQSHHRPPPTTHPRLSQVDKSLYPTPSGLCHGVNAAII